MNSNEACIYVMCRYIDKYTPYNTYLDSRMLSSTAKIAHFPMERERERASTYSVNPQSENQRYPRTRKKLAIDDRAYNHQATA